MSECAVGKVLTRHDITSATIIYNILRDELFICGITKSSGFLYHGLHIHEVAYAGYSTVIAFDLYGCCGTKRFKHPGISGVKNPGLIGSYLHVLSSCSEKARLMETYLAHIPASKQA